MRRSAALIAFAAAAWVGGALAAEPKVLRVPFLIAETNFDPAYASDTYSNTVIDEIFEPPLTYEFLARASRLTPQTGTALP